MTQPDQGAIRESFHRQAETCRKLGSPLTAGVIAAVETALDGGSETGRRILGWRGDPDASGDALALRVAGGLHALARSGEDIAVAAAYAGDGDLAAAVAGALGRHDARLASWLDMPPQTNEVGRAAAIMAGLLVAAARFALPIELLELGSSAGLVLNVDRYRYDLGGRIAGNSDAALLLAPEWEGPPPPRAKVVVVARRGVDRSPIRLAAPGSADRLAAYVWPDQPERLAALEAAIAIARAHPPPIDAGEADAWIAARLGQPQPAGVMRIVFHTIVLQYLDASARAATIAAIERAGSAASETRPLGWLSFEQGASGSSELRLRHWPGGAERHLANAHPHARWVEWRAPAA